MVDTIKELGKKIQYCHKPDQNQQNEASPTSLTRETQVPVNHTKVNRPSLPNLTRKHKTFQRCKPNNKFSVSLQVHKSKREHQPCNQLRQ
ncbi:MAG: hypothetical protein ACE1S7_06655 [Candidatus Tisiphia sp.]